MMKVFKVLFVVLPVLLATMLGSTSAFAGGKGFVDERAGGTMVRTRDGGCLQTRDWKKGMGKCGAKPKKMKPKDSDGDGVVDSKDACPGTPPGVKVDARGCEVVKTITISDVNFDFDKATLRGNAKSSLDAAAGQLSNPNIKSVSVTGYTDSTGPEAYNQGLSERRANAVMAYLEGKGVSNASASGAGESNPVADNSTRDGRAQNRRVEIDVSL